MPEINLQIERMLEIERLREKSLSQPEGKISGALDPPRSWRTQFYEDEYKPLFRPVKIVIKYGAIILALCIALDYGSRHLRNTFCQWGWDRH